MYWRVWSIAWWGPMDVVVYRIVWSIGWCSPLDGVVFWAGCSIKYNQ